MAYDLDLRVVSDGTRRGTKVEHAPTGQSLNCIKSVSIEAVAGEGNAMVRVVLEVYATIDAVGYKDGAAYRLQSKEGSAAYTSLKDSNGDFVRYLYPVTWQMDAMDKEPQIDFKLFDFAEDSKLDDE